MRKGKKSPVATEVCDSNSADREDRALTIESQSVDIEFNSLQKQQN